MLIAHHGVAVDNIRFDSCRTTFFVGTNFCADPNVSRNGVRILSGYTKRVSVVKYAWMALGTFNDIHKIWEICGEKQKNGRAIWVSDT